MKVRGRIHTMGKNINKLKAKLPIGKVCVGLCVSLSVSLSVFKDKAQTKGMKCQQAYPQISSSTVLNFSHFII